MQSRGDDNIDLCATSAAPVAGPKALASRHGRIACLDPTGAIASVLKAHVPELAARQEDGAGAPPLAVCAWLRTDLTQALAFLAHWRTNAPQVPRIAFGLADDACALMAAINRAGVIRYVPMPPGPEDLAGLRALLGDPTRLGDDVDSDESQRLLRDIVEHLPTAVQLKSVRDHYRMVMWNRAAEAMYGVPRKEAIGHTVHDLWPRADADRMHASDLELLRERRSVEFRERPAQTRDRGEILVHMRKVPLYDAAGAPSHLLVIADEVTEQVAAARALRDMQARYQRALDGSRDAVWEFDLASRQLFHSHRLDELLGTTEKGVQMRELLRRAEPAARRGLIRAWRDLLEGQALRWEGALVCGDGARRWFRVRGTLTRDASGRPALASGTVGDIEAEYRAREELRRHRDNLAELVDERTAGLLEATQAAEQANRAKSEFLANISHELRTPMHAIVSFANFGFERFERSEPARLKGYFERIQQSAARLLGLLNDLLDLARMEAGRMSMNAADIEVPELVQAVLAEAEAFAQSCKVKVRGALPDHGEWRVRWDAARIHQVLRNLLSNAIKFSPPDTCVTVTLASGPEDTVVLSVADQGVGIPEGELDSVFDKFVQSSRTKSGAGGTGLGLAICREIVAMHRGRIHAAHQPAPLRGAIFTIELPRDAGELPSVT